MKILKRLFGKRDSESTGKSSAEIEIVNNVIVDKTAIVDDKVEESYLLPLIKLMEDNEAISFELLGEYGGTTISFQNGAVRIDVNKNNTYIYNSYYSIRKFCDGVEDNSGYMYFSDEKLTPSIKIRLSNSFAANIQSMKERKIMTTLENLVNSFERGSC